MALQGGVIPAGEAQDAVAWSVLGHRYFLKAESDACFCFETLDPPGTFVPPHVHPDQDEFIWVLEGVIDLRLGEGTAQARPGDLVGMPRGVPHAYYDHQPIASRALFWVSPSGRLRQLFDQLHELTDVDEVVRLSRGCGVEFLPPP